MLGVYSSVASGDPAPSSPNPNEVDIPVFRRSPRRRLRTTCVLSLALGSVAVGLVPTAPASAPAEAATYSWTRVLRNNFTDLSRVARMQSSVAVNDTLSPFDTTNALLQKPVVRGNVRIASDSAAGDGHALAVLTRKTSYETSAGTQTGWANGRAMLTNADHVPPVRIRARIRMTKSIGAKTAVMWWPKVGWPWEVDFAETFSGQSWTDKWGSRSYVSQRWHADLDGDGLAKEQLIRDIAIDATRYHVYDLYITPARMWVTIDGVERFSTTDTRYIPDSAGALWIGKALGGGPRNDPDRTFDGVYLDWVEIYKPA